MPTSRKSAMVSRLWANLSIQIIHEPPGGGRERIGSYAPLTRRHKSDKQVTNGVGEEKKVGGAGTLPWRPLGLTTSTEQALETIHRQGLLFRACTQVIRMTERYLKLTDKLLDEQ